MNELPFHSLPSFSRVRTAFAEPIADPAAAPDGLVPLVARIGAWDRRTRASWTRLDRQLVFRRVISIGTAIADAMHCQRAIRTRPIDDWLASASEADANGFERWRDAFFVRCDALAAFATEGLVASDLVMPEGGLFAMMLSNPMRLGDLVGGRRYPLATLGIFIGATAIVVRERDFFLGLVRRQLRRSGISLTTTKWRAVADRLNATAGKTLITHRHIEELRAAFAALEAQGVNGPRADSLVVHALERGLAASGKPWKGLARFTEMVNFSGIDPIACPMHFDAAMDAPVDYTHVPGREWIVRDYALGRRLMQIDGKIAPGDTLAGLQQGRGSLATGYLRGGHERIEFGRRYSKPLQAFLDSMVVAEGPDHQRQRKAFLPFFAPSEVLAQAAFVESTVTQLLDRASAVARLNDGAFDFRNDFAYQYPIRIVCRMLDLPDPDVAAVQHWAEASVRAMDTDAGVGFTIARDGQEASVALRHYLEDKLAGARAGTFGGRVIGEVARDETLSEAERIANLGVIIFAGFETTTGLLSKGMEALLRHPDQWAHLRDSLIPTSGDALRRDADREWRWLAWAQGQPERSIAGERWDRLSALLAGSPDAAARFAAVRRQEAVLDDAIEEMLRWTAPGTVVPLTASKDITVALESAMHVKGRPHRIGDQVTFRRGETIAVAVDELNRRCPMGHGRFDGAATGGFDVSRVDNHSHLSFGLRHACIGAFLAKENAKRAVEGVLRRFPDLELAGDPIPQEMELFSGLAELPVRSLRAAG